MENGRNSAHLNAFKFCKFGDPIIFSNYFTILIIQKKEKKNTHTHTQGREHDSSYLKFKEELVQIVAAGPDMVS